MDSPQTRKAGLNLPTGMSETSLRLESFSGSFGRYRTCLPPPSPRLAATDSYLADLPRGFTHLGSMTRPRPSKKAATRPMPGC
ncbi:hypothetical protein Prudu_007268 [Prunus dulcis]|uniref:Uncharacterized protein n=1 Tax=Prunus dulcis TaxID=3755 RepID=A0A4Y1R1R4_PRUDU|nr:hypothetical protein Prudu_007268 [Prunus dulcis]